MAGRPACAIWSARLPFVPGTPKRALFLHFDYPQAGVAHLYYIRVNPTADLKDASEATMWVLGSEPGKDMHIPAARTRRRFHDAVSAFIVYRDSVHWPHGGALFVQTPSSLLCRCKRDREHAAAAGIAFQHAVRGD
ncbi:hypothetical protein GGF32_009614 [Allomyces javanicus]|nr:hypothetical protein GGF32_009614 [Allomyces javanicus]